MSGLGGFSKLDECGPSKRQVFERLGKNVIRVTQSAEFVPFDLRAVQFIIWRNNGEGREALVKKVMERIETLMQFSD